MWTRHGTPDTVDRENGRPKVSKSVNPPTRPLPSRPPHSPPPGANYPRRGNETEDGVNVRSPEGDTRCPEWSGTVTVKEWDGRKVHFHQSKGDPGSGPDQRGREQSRDGTGVREFERRVNMVSHPWD